LIAGFFYNAFEEQLLQSAYDELQFKKRIQLLLEAEKVVRDNKKAHKLTFFYQSQSPYTKQQNSIDTFGGLIYAYQF